jgi:hypothetical protein
VILGRAAVMMWWDIAAEMEREFEHWHSIEHMPERLAIPRLDRCAPGASTTPST